MKEIKKYIDKNIEEEFDYSGLEILKEISDLPNVMSPIVALPDFHAKKNMEAPSSIAVAVKDNIIPHLSSCSLNCGMGAITTNLIANNGFEEKILPFLEKFRDERNNEKYTLSRNELKEVLFKGPKALQEKYNIDDNVIDSFEKQGNLLDSNNFSIDDVSKLIPESILVHPTYNALIDLGVGFGGNHFLEIQKVEEIFDKEICKENNVNEKGQIVVMYHGGGGIFPGFIGGYFAKRMKGYDTSIGLVLDKIKYHLPHIKGFNSLIKTFYYFFSKNRYISVPESSLEGRRLILANNCAMNYGFMYRLFMYLRVKDAFCSIFGESDLDVKLFKDVSHNSIQKERINDHDIWVHRHNSCRIVKDSLTVLPGYNNTSSYLCVGLEGASSVLNSVPHGAGDAIKAYKKLGISKEIIDRQTMIYSGNSKTPEYICHMSDEGIDSVVKLLSTENVMRPIARLTPIAVLKNYN